MCSLLMLIECFQIGDLKYVTKVKQQVAICLAVRIIHQALSSPQREHRALTPRRGGSLTQSTRLDGGGDGYGLVCCDAGHCRSVHQTITIKKVGTAQSPTKVIPRYIMIVQPCTPFSPFSSSTLIKFRFNFASSNNPFFIL